MSDIVNELIEASFNENRRLYREAAHEIERLQAKLAEAEALLRDLCMGHPDNCACRGCKFAFRAPDSACS